MNEKLIEVLSDLIEINNARVVGYEQAAEECKDLDADLQVIFKNMANESKIFAAELTNEITKLGGVPLKESKNKEKLQEAWMDIKSSFSGRDRQSILELCEFSENVVQRGYNNAFASEAEIETSVGEMITNQKAHLKTAHKLVKNYRNAYWKLIDWKSSGLACLFLFG